MNEQRSTVEHELNRPQLADGKNIFYIKNVKIKLYFAKIVGAARVIINFWSESLPLIVF